MSNNAKRFQQKHKEAEDMKGSNNQQNTFKTKTDVSAEFNRKTKPLTPLNGKQQEYIDAINNHAVVICTGVWGSSKTYIPTRIACEKLLKKEIYKVVIARPAEGKAKSVGFYKGDKNQKLEGWCCPVTDTMKQFLGVGNYEAYLENGRIELLSLEQVKGRSWDDAFIIIDESEDLEPPVAKSLVGRQGNNTTTVITGDINQKDLKSYSGLELLLEVAKFGDIDLVTVDFDEWRYCVRSEEAKQWGIAFERYEKSHGRIK